MSCHSCNFNVEGFENIKNKQENTCPSYVPNNVNSKDSRCPKTFPVQNCIYTAQGFEFDYVGVIVGDDLMYDKENDKLIANKSGTRDPVLKRSKEKFDEHVKNIYRVLMTRGMKGCYVYFTNNEVAEYFRRNLFNH